MVLPYVGGSYRIMNLLQLRAYVHLHRGESAAAARDVEALLRAATIHRLEPLAMSQLYYSRHVEGALQAVERLLPQFAHEEATLQRMQQHLETIDMLESLRLAAIGDRVLGLTTLDDPSTAGAGRVPPRLYSAWVRDSKHKLLETLKDLDRRFSGPWPAPLQNIRDYPLPADREEDVVSPWGGTEWFAPSEFARQRVKAVETFARTEARAKAAATAIASIRFEKQQGHWPNDVKELVPEFLDEPPLDPFTGDVLVLRKDRESIHIYSVGPNLKDDGGVESSDEKKAPTGSPDVVFRLLLPATNGN